MKDYTQVERDNAALTIREYAFGQMNMLRMLGDEDAANNLQEAINMAIAALRDAQARQEGCEYCEDGFECDTNHFHTRPDWMLLNDINDCIPAHYCPNCGRHLASDQAKEGGE